MANISLFLPVAVFFHLVKSFALENATIAEAFPEIAVDFPNFPKAPPILTEAYSYGRQDMGKCCSLAVYHSLIQRNGSICLANESFIGNNLDSFRDQQYSCHATYIGNKHGAPPVTITYGWCLLNCPGWQRSDVRKPKQWLLPVVGFIAPSVVFCLSIPRR